MASPVFKTVWASVLPAPVGSTPMRPRHVKRRNDAENSTRTKKIATGRLTVHRSLVPDLVPNLKLPMLIDERLVARLDELVSKGRAVVASAGDTSRSAYCDFGIWAGWNSQTVNFLERTLGVESTYTKHFVQSVGVQVQEVRAGIEILNAIKDDIQGGHLVRLRELVHADVFSDFLEMAEYLMLEDHGYKEPAAVLAGGVLEEHVRLLCTKHGIATERNSPSGQQPKKADQLNNDLVAASVYDRNQQKIVTGWLGIRNSAAHGKHDEYTESQVEQLLVGLRDFISRFPA